MSAAGTAPAGRSPSDIDTTYLFCDSTDIENMDADDALRHAVAAQRILALMLTALFDEREQICPGDAELLEAVARRGKMWTERALDLLAESAAQEPASAPQRAQDARSGAGAT